jgi:hypothetical protein
MKSIARRTGRGALQLLLAAALLAPAAHCALGR